MAAKPKGPFNEKMYKDFEEAVNWVQNCPGWVVITAFIDKVCEELQDEIMNDINPNSYEKKFGSLDIKKTQWRAWKDMKSIFDMMKAASGQNAVIVQDAQLAKEAEQSMRNMSGGIKTSIQALAETFGVPKPPAV